MGSLALVFLYGFGILAVVEKFGVHYFHLLHFTFFQASSIGSRFDAFLVRYGWLELLVGVFGVGIRSGTLKGSASTTTMISSSP
jgi:hypothetical protein